MAKYCMYSTMNTLVYMEEPHVHHYSTSYTGSGLGQACIPNTLLMHIMCIMCITSDAHDAHDARIMRASCAHHELS